MHLTLTKPPPRYKQLICVKDWRTLHKKVIHRDARGEHQKLRQLEESSTARRRAREEAEARLYAEV